MTNKITRLAVAITIVLIATFSIIRIFFSSTNSPTFKIFKAEADGFYFHKLLGIIPSSYQDRYSKTILESFGSNVLFSLVDDMGPANHNYLVLKSGATSKFLKAYPFELVGVKDEAVQRNGWVKHVSLSINTNVFNEYVHSRKLQSKDTIVKMYCAFLSNSIDGSMHKILHDEHDVDSLITHRPPNNLEFIKTAGFDLIDAKSINFDHPDNSVYCWFCNTGVVKFIFDFNDDNTIKSVDSTIVGFLGNEVPGI